MLLAEKNNEIEAAKQKGGIYAPSFRVGGTALIKDNRATDSSAACNVVLTWQPITDINGHWARHDILFVSNRDFMTGTSSTTFSPNGSMTRGMFVTKLGRLADADVSGYTKISFTTVKANAYYMGYG